MKQKDLNEISRLVQKVTDTPRVAVFLREIITYQKRHNVEGGLTGLTKSKYQVARKSGIKFTGESEGVGYCIKLRNYAPYHELRTNDLACLIYTVGYIRAFNSEIPHTQADRFSLFKFLFVHDADNEHYFSM